MQGAIPVLLLVRRFLQLLAMLLAAWPIAQADQPVIACSFSIPADWTRVVMGDAATVRSLLGPNADLHSFQPNPTDVRRLISADLIVGIDPSLEPWLKEIVDSNNLSGKVLWLGSPWLSDLGHTVHTCDDPEHKHTTAQPHGEVDPHVWMDPVLVVSMVNALADRCRQLKGIDPESLETRRAAYVASVVALDRELGDLFEKLPADQRGIVTHHGNLGRFAERYGLRVAGIVLRSSSTEAADPSARGLAELIRLCRESRVRVIVRDRGQRAPAAETLAREAGLPPPLELSVDSLDAPGTPGETWLGMMRENGRRLQGALRGP